MKISIKTFALAAFIALCSASCTRDIYPDFSGPSSLFHVFKASFSPDTRTILENDSKVSWAQNDTIRLCLNDTTSFVHVVEADGPSTTIPVQIPENSTYLSAVYGADSIFRSSKEHLLLSGVAPSVQDGKFPSVHVSVAHLEGDALEGTELPFHNITGLVKFEVVRKDVAYVEFSPNNADQSIASDSVAVSFASGVPVAALVDSEKSSKTIKVMTEAPGTYYFSIVPCTLTGGFTLNSYNASGDVIWSLTHNQDLDIPSSTITDLGSLERVGFTDLSVTETANCYIASRLGGHYSFNAAVKGNSTEPLDGVPVDAEVLWEARGDDVTPNLHDIITDVAFADNRIYFKAVGEGNALIAVRNQGGRILWSWHIWVWDGYNLNDFTQDYYNNAGSMMDRNLGAVSNVPGNRGCFGLFYQWGRKDPFPGSSTCYVGTTRMYVQETNSTDGSEEGVIPIPTTFLAYSSASGRDWVYSERINDLWTVSKSKNDPCPPGWKVPDKGIWGRAAGCAGSFGHRFDTQKEGMEFGDQSDTLISPGHGFGKADHIWYPVGGGYRNGSNTSSIVKQGDYSFYWSCETDDKNAYVLGILPTHQVSIYTTMVRACGLNVRCMKDEEHKTIPVESISLSPKTITLKRFVSQALKCTVTPSNAENQSIKWWSESEEYVSVDQNGRITANKVTEAPCKIYAMSIDNNNAVDVCEVTVEPDTFTDLSAGNKTANCYIVTHPGTYRFSTDIQDGGKVVHLDVDDVDIYWQAYGGTLKYNPERPVIKEPKPEQGYISFDVPTPMQDGNALIVGLKDGTVVWSWHIWACYDYDPDAKAQAYKNSAGTMMDRNLGALSAKPGDPLSFGLMYQWGRKDPFLGPASKDSKSKVDCSRSDLYEVIPSSSNTGTDDYARKNPTKFIGMYSTSTFDWLYIQDDNRWTSDKSLQDPCPYGWRVPDGGPDGIWAKALRTDDPEQDIRSIDIGAAWDKEVLGGANLGGIISDEEVVWYPDAAYLDRQNGAVEGEGQFFKYWSVTTRGKFAYMFGNNNSSVVTPCNEGHRAYGASVRCMKIDNPSTSEVQ